ncbi:hypothetical protein E143388_07620 [Rhodococcus opacus]|nr:hypothetical protein E143388_07620 [Rhodococcus opacus]
MHAQAGHRAIGVVGVEDAAELRKFVAGVPTDLRLPGRTGGETKAGEAGRVNIRCSTLIGRPASGPGTARDGWRGTRRDRRVRRGVRRCPPDPVTGGVACGRNRGRLGSRSVAESVATRHGSPTPSGRRPLAASTPTWCGDRVADRTGSRIVPGCGAVKPAGDRAAGQVLARASPVSAWPRIVTARTVRPTRMSLIVAGVVPVPRP